MNNLGAIIIALGQPSNPLPHDDTLRELAGKVAAELPGWTVRGATLESQGSVSAATDGLRQPLIYPLFMASGFFTAQVMPKRLARIVPDAPVLPPFGADPAVPRLVADAVLAAAREHGMLPEDTSLLLAAHGSEMFPASRLATQDLAQEVAARTGFRKVVTGFIEEKPYIEESARDLGQAICLPVFVLRASHVAVDVPEALRRADFKGVVLDPIGMHAGVPAIIAAALRRHSLQAVA